MFNSREYGWADLTLILAGRDCTRIRSAKYEEKAEKEALFAKGRKAIAIQTGNIMVEGEIGMLWSEFDALCDAGGGSHLGLTVDGNFSFGNPALGDAMRTERIVSISFTGGAKELKQGDKFGEVTVPFIALDILRNV